MTEARSTRDDSGFTVVEIMITLLISSLVLTAILGILDSQMRIERRVTAFANNQEELRDALISLQRDIRSSEPLVALPTIDEHKLKLRLNVYTDATSAPTPIQWSATPGGELVREDLSQSPPWVTHRLKGLDPNLDQLFFYFMTNGELNLAPPAPNVPPQPADVATCTVAIKIVLRATPEAGPAVSPLESDVQLRNRTRAPQGCPASIPAGP